MSAIYTFIKQTVDNRGGFAMAECHLQVVKSLISPPDTHSRFSKAADPFKEEMFPLNTESANEILQ